MKPTTLSITEAQKLGFGRVARDAEEAGVIVLERHSKAIAMVTPMTPAGFVRFMEVMFASLTPHVASGDTDAQEYLGFMMHLAQKRMGVNITSKQSNGMLQFKVELPTPQETQQESPTKRKRAPSRRKAA